eukprot:scaffold2332_cov260-Prasinococcus_capsulatus_cf.AAC.1
MGGRDPSHGFVCLGEAVPLAPLPARSQHENVRATGSSARLPVRRREGLASGKLQWGAAPLPLRERRAGRRSHRVRRLGGAAAQDGVHHEHDVRDVHRAVRVDVVRARAGAAQAVHDRVHALHNVDDVLGAILPQHTRVRSAASSSGVRHRAVQACAQGRRRRARTLFTSALAGTSQPSGSCATKLIAATGAGSSPNCRPKKLMGSFGTVGWLAACSVVPLSVPAARAAPTHSARRAGRDAGEDAGGRRATHLRPRAGSRSAPRSSTGPFGGRTGPGPTRPPSRGRGAALTATLTPAQAQAQARAHLHRRRAHAALEDVAAGVELLDGAASDGVAQLVLDRQRRACRTHTHTRARRAAGAVSGGPTADSARAVSGAPVSATLFTPCVAMPPASHIT